MEIELTIRISGESAEDLLAVGERDLEEYFLPKGKMKIPRNDIEFLTINKIYTPQTRP